MMSGGNIIFTKKPGKDFAEASKRFREEGGGHLVLTRLTEDNAEAKTVFEEVLRRLEEEGIKFQFLCAVKETSSDFPRMDLSVEFTKATQARAIALDINSKHDGGYAVEIIKASFDNGVRTEHTVMTLKV